MRLLCYIIFIVYNEAVLLFERNIADIKHSNYSYQLIIQGFKDSKVLRSNPPVRTTYTIIAIKYQN